MAKLALINRELKRKACAQKFAAKRAALKAVINDATRSMEERMEARNALQSLPRDASPCRQRNRCELTGRPAEHSANSVWQEARSAKRLCMVTFPA